MGVSAGPDVSESGLVLALDTGNTKSYPVKNFVSSKIYSVFNGSLRSANYTVQYSDDNTNWTTAFSGVSSNNTSCGIQQNTGSGNGSYGFHRYWRYVEGSAVTLHHPRVSRIILTDVNGVDYNLVVYTSDNCSDSGTYIVGTVSLDFGGTTWTDLSGRGYVGTLYNNTTYNGSNGGGLVFDGTDDFVDVNSTNIITGTNPFTIDCWFTLSGGNYGELFGNYGSGYTTGYVWFATAGLYIDGSCYIPNYATATQGTHYIAATRNSSGACVTYLDGVSVATATLTSSILVGPNFRIGADTKSTAPTTSDLGEELNGKIYQLKVYNKALTASEIQQNFNANRARFGI